VICAIARWSSRLAGPALASSGAIAEFGDLARLEFRFRDDFAVDLDQHLLDDFRAKRNRRRQGCQTDADHRLLQHNNSLILNILLDDSGG
jgi:hypothetical protein